MAIIKVDYGTIGGGTPNLIGYLFGKASSLDFSFADNEYVSLSGTTFTFLKPCQGLMFGAFSDSGKTITVGDDKMPNGNYSGIKSSNFSAKAGDTYSYNGGTVGSVVFYIIE